MRDSMALACAARDAALAKKAADVVVLDVRELTPVTDFFVICDSPTATHLTAVSGAVSEAMEQAGAGTGRKEGSPESGWVILDYGDVVVHLFRDRERHYYDIERLWRPMPRTT